LRFAWVSEYGGCGLIQAARDLDPRMSFSNVVPFSEIVNRSLMIERLMAQVSTAFALLALLMPPPARTESWRTTSFGAGRKSGSGLPLAPGPAQSNG